MSCKPKKINFSTSDIKDFKRIVELWEIGNSGPWGAMQVDRELTQLMNKHEDSLTSWARQNLPNWRDINVYQYPALYLKYTKEEMPKPDTARYEKVDEWARKIVRGS